MEMSIPNAVELKGRRNGDVYSQCSGTEGPEEWRCLFPKQRNRRASEMEVSIPNAVEGAKDRRQLLPGLVGH